jgi:hypothetical protein
MYLYNKVLVVVSEARVSRTIATVTAVICLIQRVVRVNRRSFVVRVQIGDYVSGRQEVMHS